jgi:LPXTG-motif cell wall-anchored protein
LLNAEANDAAAPQSPSLDSPAIGGITVGVIAFVAALAALAALLARRRKKKPTLPIKAEPWKKGPVAADTPPIMSTNPSIQAPAAGSQNPLFRASVASPVAFAAMNPMNNKKMAFAQVQIK